ncbi:MAG: LacI family transcriptional regulator [Actinobacteria bacterium]|nr:LacI family transcriptional regulator [Actinomycetota bacterium]MCG2802695.1 LacI family transcriptional regulator [Cellulomonas sp.]
MTGKPVRLVDIAREAGVSLGAASQVMNGTGRIGQATQRRVLEAAERLGYRPNALARSIASGRSRTIAILAENASGQFCMPVLVGLNRALSGANLTSILYDAAHDDDLRAAHLREIQGRQAEGVVVIGEGPDVPASQIPHEVAGLTVYAFARPPGDGGVSVVPDNEQGGRLAAEHLQGLGRRTLVHVTAQAGLQAVTDRATGFVRGAEAAGSEVRVLYGGFDRRWGYEAADRILAEAPGTDAVFAGNDQIAVGLAAQLHARGVRIPQDVAIIGFDNVAGIEGDLDPFLTSVDPALTAVGTRAAQVVVDTLSGSAAAPASAVVPCWLAVGRSTVGGPADGRDHVLEELLLH